MVNEQQDRPEVRAQSDSFKHAIVLGGSLTGLLTARVLADHFETVTLIERDGYPETAEARKGIPQANHVHALLLRGRQILEQLFPGLQDEMIADGAPLVDMAKEIAWFNPAGWGVKFPSDLMVLSFTRPLLDLHIRKRLQQNPKIRILENTRVIALAPHKDRRRVAGVIIPEPREDSDRVVGQTLLADLILDTTGRSSSAPKWLRDLGFDSPTETTVDAHLGYASRLYKIPDDFDADWLCAILQRAPPHGNRGGLIFRVEGERWLVTLVGGGNERPPADEEGFLEFVRNLPDPIIYDAIKHAEPLSAIKTHRSTQNRLRHFELMKSLPANFLLLGDSVCAFNPVYGQGMTVAAIGVMALDQTLREYKSRNLDRLSSTFQKRLAKLNKAPWMMATSEDFRFPETEGDSPSFATRLMHKYMDQVMRLSTHSSEVRDILLRVFNMLLPPAALFRPTILFRVLYQLTKARADATTRKERKRVRTWTKAQETKSI